MKEINILEAIQMPQLMIDMVTPVKDYEKYDFHVGMKCKIDGFPFELMSENGKLSLEAGAIMLTARRRREQEVLASDVAKQLQLYSCLTAMQKLLHTHSLKKYGSSRSPFPERRY